VQISVRAKRCARSPTRVGVCGEAGVLEMARTRACMGPGRVRLGPVSTCTSTSGRAGRRRRRRGVHLRGVRARARAGVGASASASAVLLWACARGAGLEHEPEPKRARSGSCTPFGRGGGWRVVASWGACFVVRRSGWNLLCFRGGAFFFFACFYFSFHSFILLTSGALVLVGVRFSLSLTLCLIKLRCTRCAHTPDRRTRATYALIGVWRVLGLGLGLVLGGLLAPLGFNAFELPVLVSLGLGGGTLHDHGIVHAFRLSPLTP
jgi:hypothetical protein